MNEKYKGLEKLQENYSFTPESYHKLTESEIIEKYPHLNKLNESSFIESINDKHLQNTLRELNSKNMIGSLPIWKVPISKCGHTNSNKRIYGRKLWENVINNQQSNWKGLYGLLDHPEKDDDPGKMKDVCSVWHDMYIDGDTVYGICSLVGEAGKMINEILSCGGRAGTSTSGFGKVDPITKEVDPNSYICERTSDWVIAPSQGTYADGSCPHTTDPREFMKDVHQGATINFNKQDPIREAQSAILRRNKMASPNQVNAAAPAAATQPQQTGTAPQQQAAAPAVNQQAVQAGQKQQPVKESTLGGENMLPKNNALSKIEEKAFRKYAEAFMENAKNMDDPIKRLNECNDILDCFDDGICPDLKVKLEETLQNEKTRLEALVESVVRTEKDYGVDIKTFRDTMEKRLTEGVYLQEQIVDYEKLCEGLTSRNKNLSDENDKLKKMISLRTKLTEKNIESRNKTIVEVETEIDNLKEEIKELKSKNSRIMERVSNFSMSNKKFEKENGVLQTKLKEAAGLIKKSRDSRFEISGNAKQLAEENTKIKESLASTQEKLKKITEAYEINKTRYDRLNESFNAYKEEIADNYNPVKHIVPNSTERVGKYLNLRENKGIEVETYWQEQLEKYGETIMPFEDSIRNAKTLREATTFFLKNRSAIDPDFAIASPIEGFAFRNRSERAKLMEAQGIPIPSRDEWTTEQLNSEFQEKLSRQGLL